MMMQEHLKYGECVKMLVNKHINNEKLANKLLRRMRWWV